MRTLAVVLVALTACGDPAWILPEVDAIEITDAELEVRGLATSVRDHQVSTSLVTVQLDGWDPVAQVGYEYVADPDPELGAASPYAEIDGADELQAAVDAAVGPDTRILIIHTWAHETEPLCRDQFLGSLQARLDALGL